MSKPAVASPSTPPNPAPPLPTLTVPVHLPFSLARQRVIEDFERVYVEQVLAKHGGNVVQAAAASGLARRYFYILKARMT